MKLIHFAKWIVPVINQLWLLLTKRVLMSYIWWDISHPARSFWLHGHFSAFDIIGAQTTLPPNKCDFETDLCDWTCADTGWKWERWLVLWSKVFAFAICCRCQNIQNICIEQNIFTKYLSPYQNICLSIQIFPGRQKESRRNGIRAGTRAWSRYGSNKYFSESVY